MIHVALLHAGSIRDRGELTQYMHGGKPWASHVPVDHTHSTEHAGCRSIEHWNLDVYMWSTGKAAACAVFDILQTLCLGWTLANGHDTGYWTLTHVYASL